MDKLQESLTDKLIYIFVKYIYIFIFFPKYIQMILIIFLIILMIKENKFKFSITKEAVPIFLVGAINFISIIFNLSGFHEKERIMAAFNTSILWCTCGMIYSYIKIHNFDKEKIKKYMFINIAILTILASLSIFLQRIGIENVNLFSRSLMRTDWLLGEKSFRFKGFLLYDNLVSQMYFLAFPFAYSYIESKKKPILTFMFLIISVLPVVMCKSRMGIILCIFTIILLLPNAITKTKKQRQLLYMMYIIIVIMIIGLKYDFIYIKMINLINGRAGSTSMRMQIYETSINVALNKSPIIGCGIRDLINGYPLGSHSTYVGLFYKTGILGFILGTIGIINTLKPLKKMPLQYKLAGLCLIIMLVTGDLDGENWLIILYGILYGSIASNTQMHI